jgi:hypothetical protein
MEIATTVATSMQYHHNFWLAVGTRCTPLLDTLSGERERLTVHEIRIIFCSVSLFQRDRIHFVRRKLFGLLYQPLMMDDECGAVGGMSGRRN